MDVTTWRMSPDEDVRQRTETWEVKPGMNVICLCRYRMTEEWADKYFRVQIGVHHDTDTLSLHPTPDLQLTWQEAEDSLGGECRFRCQGGRQADPRLIRTKTIGPGRLSWGTMWRPVTKGGGL